MLTKCIQSYQYSLSQNYQTSVNMFKMQIFSFHPPKPPELEYSLETEMEIYIFNNSRCPQLLFYTKAIMNDVLRPWTMFIQLEVWKFGIIKI